MRFTSSYTRIAVETKKAAWWIDPEGGDHDSGENHKDMFENTVEKVEEGWVRLGYIWGNPFLECSRINQRQLETAQRVLKEHGVRDDQQVMISYGRGRGAWIPFKAFYSISKPSAFREWPSRRSQRGIHVTNPCR